MTDSERVKEIIVKALYDYDFDNECEMETILREGIIGALADVRVELLEDMGNINLCKKCRDKNSAIFSKHGFF